MKTRISNLSVGAACLGAAVATIALIGCGGDGGTIGGLASSIGVSGFGGSSEMRYLDAGIKAAKAITIGDREETALGQSVAVALTNSTPVLDDSALADYVTRVGMTVAMLSARNDFTYSFGVLDSNQVAAYSGPRGYVLITRGALAAMQDEAELAGVLAHEVAHVSRRHGLKSVKDRGLLSAGVTAATAEQGLGPFTDLVGAATEDLLSKGFSQAQESESDSDAVMLVTQAGYDPSSYARFLDRMKSIGASKGGLLSTHPGIDQRIRNVNKEIAEAKASGGQTNKERFMQSTAAARQRT